MNNYKNIVKTVMLDGRVKEIDGGYIVPCPSCGNPRILKTRESVRRSYVYNRTCNTCARKVYGVSRKGKKLDLQCRQSMSLAQIQRYSNIDERKKSSDVAKIAMHRPDVRKKHMEGLHRSKWLKVRTDKGQLELLDKWNKLGFNFEPNYQIHTDIDLFYVDGYDKAHNVILEYDSEYHTKPKQQKIDLIRQNKIIKLLNPTVFWRYNSVIHKFDDVYRSNKNFNNKTVPVGIEKKEEVDANN